MNINFQLLPSCKSKRTFTLFQLHPKSCIHAGHVIWWLQYWVISSLLGLLSDYNGSLVTFRQRKGNELVEFLQQHHSLEKKLQYLVLMSHPADLGQGPVVLWMTLQSPDVDFVTLFISTSTLLWRMKKKTCQLKNQRVKNTLKCVSSLSTCCLLLNSWPHRTTTAVVKQYRHHTVCACKI